MYEISVYDEQIKSINKNMRITDLCLVTDESDSDDETLGQLSSIIDFIRHYLPQILSAVDWFPSISDWKLRDNQRGGECVSCVKTVERSWINWRGKMKNKYINLL